MATKRSWSMDENNYLDANSVDVDGDTLGNVISSIYMSLLEKINRSAIGITDANGIATSGFFRAPTGTLNTPSTSNGWFIYHASTSANWGTQIAVSMASTKQVFVRNIQNGVWTAWTEIAVRNNSYGDLSYTGATYTVSPDSVSCPSGTVTDLTSVDLPKGIYVMTGIVRFASNATGRRKMTFSNTAGTDGSAIDSDIRAAVSGDMTYCRVTTVREVTAATETWYLNATQTSGTALGALGRVKIVRIA